jgi:hypothetical protein
MVIVVAAVETYDEILLVVARMGSYPASLLVGSPVGMM